MTNAKLGSKSFCVEYLFRWCESDKGKEDDKLPQKQQFLVTKKVSCEQRIKDIESAA